MIHPTAIIAPGARIADRVQIGPYSVIGEHVSLGEGTVVGPHAVIEGWTEIGRDNRIFQFASVGAIPQDLKFHGEKTWLRIGDRNTIREFASLHLGTEEGGGETLVGNDNLFMANAHVAHDCRIGNHVILANGATCAGHVEVGDFAILGGLSAIHQFTRIGSHAMLSGGSMVAQDIVPFAIAQGDRALPVGVNHVGMKRRGYSEEAVRAVRQAFKVVFRSGILLEAALAQIESTYPDQPEITQFVRFIKGSQRGIAR